MNYMVLYYWLYSCDDVATDREQCTLKRTVQQSDHRESEPWRSRANNDARAAQVTGEEETKENAEFVNNRKSDRLLVQLQQNALRR